MNATDRDQPKSTDLLRTLPIGTVRDVAGASSRIVLSVAALHALAEADDPALRLSGQVGNHVKMRVGEGMVLATVRGLRTGSDGLVGEIDFVGEGSADEEGVLRDFRQGVTLFPLPGTEVYPVTDADLSTVFAADARAHITVGTVYPTSDIRAALYVDPLLGKHFAVLGSTGTGKSTAVALILHRIAEIAPKGHVVMIDPHGEYGAAFAQNAALFSADNLQLPYWLMNLDEHAEVLLTSEGADRRRDTDILAKALLTARRKAGQGLTTTSGSEGVTVDTPVPYLLSDLHQILIDEMGRLDRGNEAGPYQRIIKKLDEVRTDPRYQFMFAGMLVQDRMADVMTTLFRLPAEGKPLSIIDVSGVPSDVVRTVVSTLGRLALDYAVWAREEEQHPILFICEEAHRYVPRDDGSGGGQAVRRVLERIAKEGRKYGVSLGLVTQRPSDLASGVLSQCGTILSMRLNNHRDQEVVAAAMPEGAQSLIDAIPALRNREAVVSGEGVSLPLRLRFDTLEEERRPNSDDPAFAALWNREGDERATVDRAISRWRGGR
ncbi:DUF87 domain-containing protein [Sphingomicrobium sp. XHP0239]|uniref:ATP-binding protein n=1 Tax=Sphingomicrobium maritimum TaxID=3133972 RepID=UPI0031CCB8FF